MSDLRRLPMRTPIRHPWATTLLLAAVAAVVIALVAAPAAVGGDIVDLRTPNEDDTEEASSHADLRQAGTDKPAVTPIDDAADDAHAPHPTSETLADRRAAEQTEPETLRPGDSGPEVEALQRRLDDLGYWLGPVDGTYGELTRQAVLAFQGEEGLARDGLAGPQVSAALEAAERPRAHAGPGDRIEVDLDRQVLRVVEDGAVAVVLHVSTGHGGTYEHPDGDTRIATTPTGTYEIERRIDGWRNAPLGDLYRPAYFVGGIAIHGFTDVPAEPASAGCVRVTLEAMDHLWTHGHVTEGTTVLVH